jgi:hypothetical protein
MIPNDHSSSRLRRALTGLKHRPRWLLMFVFLNALLAGIDLGMQPAVRQAAFDRLPPGAGKQDRVVLTQMFEEQLPFRLAFLPVRNAAGWGLFALCLYYAALAFRPLEPVRFSQVFALEVWAESALALGNLATLIRVWMIPSGPQPGTPAFSLRDIVSPVGALEPDVILGTLNLFALLYLAVLTLGMAVICGFRTGRSVLLVVSLWAASQMLNLAVLEALRDLLHFKL